MRQMEICRKTVELYSEKPSTLVYYVTVEEETDPASGAVLEAYGVGVAIIETGETEIIPDVTFSKSDILSLIELLAYHLVTPATVSDVVSDWLCEN